MTNKEMLNDIQNVIAEYVSDNGIDAMNMVLNVRVVNGSVEPIIIAQ